MKINHTYIIGFATAIVLFVLSSNIRFKDIEEINTSTHASELAILSRNVNVVNFISNSELYESPNYEEDDDEANIIYPNEQAQHLSTSYFIVDDFLEYDRNASDSTRYKIKTLHIPQLERVRDVTGLPIIIKSAARSYEHEISRGRSGKSQHVFKRKKGAVDVSLANHTTESINELEKAVFENTEYTRVTRYPTFLHLDYYPSRYGDRGYYKNTEKGWVYIGEIKELEF